MPVSLTRLKFYVARGHLCSTCCPQILAWWFLIGTVVPPRGCLRALQRWLREGGGFSCPLVREARNCWLSYTAGWCKTMKNCSMSCKTFSSPAWLHTLRYKSEDFCKWLLQEVMWKTQCMRKGELLRGKVKWIKILFPKYWIMYSLWAFCRPDCIITIIVTLEQTEVRYWLYLILCYYW